MSEEDVRILSAMLRDACKRLDQLEARARELGEVSANARGSREATATFVIAGLGSVIALCAAALTWCINSIVDLRTVEAASTAELTEIIARHVNEDAARLGATPYAGLALPRKLQSTPEGPEPFAGPLPPAEPPPARP